MGLEGVGGSQPVNNSTGYSLESLGYKNESWEASIFNEIDRSDGNVTGELSQEQYEKFQNRVLKESLKRLEQRLDALNISTAKNRFEDDDERFGKEGIESILKCAKSKEDIDSINQMLDRLENGEDIWTADITSKFSNKKNMFAIPFAGLGFGQSQLPMLGNGFLKNFLGQNR